MKNPKSESDSFAVSWGDDQEASGLVLHEDGSVEKHALQALDERTAQFGEAIIRFAKKIPRNPVNDRLISQIIGSGTSIGANYCEADNSVSGKDFKLKVGTCRKESKEAMFFLRMIASAEPTLAGEARTLWREAKELNLIFGAIWRK
jgi:four helix bundle protein